MTAKKTIQAKEVIQDDSIYGYLGGTETYTPLVFKEMKVPKKKQFTVDVEPMSDADCTTINSLNKTLQLKMSLWYHSEDGLKFQEANKKLTEFNGEGSDFTDADFDTVQSIERYKASINCDELKFSVVEKYITNLSAPHPLNAEGKIDSKAWQAMPKKIKADIYNRIVDISMLSESDAVNLQ